MKNFSGTIPTFAPVILRIMKSIFILFFSLSFFSSYSQFVPVGELLDHWKMDGLVPSTIHDNTYNEIWGLAVNGHEYAVIGSTAGTHFIDVTNPTEIFQAFFVEGKASGPQIIHRDYHDYNGYLYAVSDEGLSSLQIIDISALPDQVEVVYDSEELIRRSHNIFIDSSSHILYSCAHNGGSTGVAAMVAFDISDPISPTFIRGFNGFENFLISHVHDAYVEDNLGYFNCGPHGLAIVDLSDIENPVLISSLVPDDYLQSGYNHSGWATEDGKHYFMADENHGLDVKVFNVEDPNDIQLMNLFNAESLSDFSIAHNLMVKGTRLYVSYYYDGLQVYDISNPSSPERKMWYPTSTRAHQDEKYQGAWGIYPFLPSGNILVSDMQEGLYVIKDYEESLGVENFQKINFGLSPNPAYDEIQLSGFNLEGMNYQVYDTFGRAYANGAIDSNQSSISIDGLSEGVYFISLSNGVLQSTQKFIVAR